MAERTGRIGVVGSNNMDLVTYIDGMPAPGETVEAPDFAMGFGGKGANQAVAAARLGSQVMMVTRIGDDLFGPRQLENFHKQGIDTTHVQVAQGLASGVAPIFVRPDGENAILIVKGANGALTPDDIDAAEADLAQCDIILLQLEVPLDAVYRTVELAARHQVTSILNPAPASPDLDIERLFGLSFFVPNESELALLTGMSTASDDQIMDAAHSLIGRGIERVVVTLGGRGARLITADDAVNIAPVSVAPVDTTGAGDAFIGSFAHFHAAGRSVVDALQLATRYAALTITRRGAQSSYAEAAEFADFAAQHD